MRFSTYYLTYMNSGAWQVRRRRALDRAGHRCQLCGKARWLHVHHVSYDHLGHERDIDLTVLCRECHMLYTWYSRLKRLIAWVGRVTRWIVYGQ